MTCERSLVSVVDDDESVRESLPDLIRQFGFCARAFSSAEAFLASESLSETRCLLLDISMPGMSGPDLQQELSRRRQEIPIVFITGTGDSTVRQRVLAQGAVECLFKPFSETALLDALNAALRMREP
jgi:FixJ family two-component response regulator